MGSPDANKIASDRGIKTDKDSLVLCNGSGEANGLIIQALCDPGDYVITEQFVYMGTTKQLSYYNVNTILYNFLSISWRF